MNLKFYLILMTMVAVISDYLLHPFYPQFFEAAFGITNPQHVGFYFSAICFVVMIAFPFWAYVAQRREELKILIYTQFVAGLLAVYCFYNTSYLQFWIVSFIMVFFKGSYLLIYPYILKIDNKENHADTIGILSVVVHFGSIMGAILGGLVVDFINPNYIFLIMAGGDFIQMFMSFYLLKKKEFGRENKGQDPVKGEKANWIPSGFVLKLGFITLIFYFSLFIINPFFSRYWEEISLYDSKVISGLVYAIPGIVALFALVVNRRRKKRGSNFYPILSALLLGVIGLFFQASKIDSVVVMSRIIYGWALFQAVVRFDVLLFELSTPKTYATDYSKIHFFQNSGVLIASFSAGIVVDQFGLQIPFIVAFIGFAVTLFLYYYCFKEEGISSKHLAKSFNK